MDLVKKRDELIRKAEKLEKEAFSILRKAMENISKEG